jgi:histidine kinase
MKSLRIRLLVSHLAVAGVGAAITIAVVLWQAPALFDRGIGHQGAGPGQGPGTSMGSGGLRQVFQDALWQAMAVGSVAALVVALAAAVFLSARMLRPLEEVRRATRTISEGDYDLQVTLPHETELAALATDVNTMADRLRDTENRRVRLLGEVAHEMRTPLTVLTGRVEGLRDGVFTVDEPLVEEMGDELRRLQRLADDLGALSRVEEGRLQLDRDEVDLSGLTARILDRYQGDPRAEGVDLRLDAPAPVRVDGDVQRLGQVVDNLLVNAFRAVAGHGTVTVRVVARGDLAEVSVEDDGRGIAADDLERIFERFYRGDPSHEGEGSGIGLTVSRGIARAHGGSLRAESRGAGQGARFVLTLPGRGPQRL